MLSKEYQNFYEEMRKKAEQYNHNRIKWHKIRKKLKEINELLKLNDIRR